MTLDAAAGDVRAIATAFGFNGEGEFTLRGRPYRANPRSSGFVRAGPGYPAVVREVGQVIYEREYVRSGHGRGPYRPLNDMILKNEFARTLHAAHRGTGSWTPGWEVVAAKGASTTLRNARGETVTVPSSRVLRKDGIVYARQDKGSTSQPGWYHARGEFDHPYGSPPTLRFYWALCAQGAVPLVACATEVLNAAGIPFRLKVTDDPQRYARADAGVLYTPASAAGRLADALPRVYAAVGPYLLAKTPAMTLPLARGLGFAVDPAGDESFGMHRARLIAEGLWDAHVAGAADPEARFASVRARFARDGIDADRPFKPRDMDVPAFDVGAPPPVLEVAA